MAIANGKDPTQLNFLQRMRAKILRQPTDIFDETNNENMPITGGNLFATQEYLNAVFSSTSLVKYNLLLDTIRCLRNVFTVEGDEFLERSWQNILTVLLIYGAVGIRLKKRLDSEILQIYGVMNFAVDDDLTIKSCEGYLPTVLNRGVTFGFDKNKSTMVKLNNNTAVFTTYGTEALSIIVRIMPFLNARYRTLKIASGNVMYHNKKIKMKYGGGSSQELDFMLDTVTSDNSKVLVEFTPELDLTVSEHDSAVIKGKKKPFIGKSGTNGIVNPTTFEPLLDRGEVNKDVWVDYDKFTEIQNEISGIRFNGAKKKSRNTTDDVKTSNAKTMLVEKDLEMSLLNLINDYNKKYGKSAKIVKTHDDEINDTDAEPTNGKEQHSE